MSLTRVQMVSFEDDDRCGKCGAEIIFRPPLPRFYWMKDRQKLCDDCGKAHQSLKTDEALTVVLGRKYG